MSAVEETPDNVVPIENPKLGLKGHKLSDEHRRKMREGYERARAEGRIGRKRKKRVSVFEESATEREAIGKLKPQALKRLEGILYDESASAAQLVNAAKLVLAYADGMPTQRVEVSEVEEIRYVLGELEPPLETASGE